MVLAHEADVLKGGAPLEVLIADAESKQLDTEYTFGGQWPIIPWHRVSDFRACTRTE